MGGGKRLKKNRILKTIKVHHADRDHYYTVTGIMAIRMPNMDTRPLAAWKGMPFARGPPVRQAVLKLPPPDLDQIAPAINVSAAELDSIFGTTSSDNFADNPKTKD
jgi:hypothetical protein